VSKLSANTIWQKRVWGLLFSLFSLVLCYVGGWNLRRDGLFVALRTREIAFGWPWAHRDTTLKLVLRTGMIVAVTGLTLGLPAHSP